MSSRSPGHPIAVLTLGGLLLGACGGPASRPEPQPWRLVPSAEVDLSSWGLREVRQVGYAAIRLEHRPQGIRLVVDDLRASPPALKTPEATTGHTPALEDGVFVISRFDGDNQNRLQGHFSEFARAPSAGSVSLRRCDGEGRTLAFDYRHQAPGWTGFWVHLFDSLAPPSARVFLDAAPIPFLTLAVRGQAGGERLLLKVADASWERREDALPVDELGAFLPAGRITRSWQRATIPLERLPARLDRRRLASLVFQVEGPGASGVCLRDLALAASATAAIPASARRPVASRPLRRALWFWETLKLLQSSSQQAELVAFCRERGVTDLFLQLPHQGSAPMRWQGLAGLLGALGRAGVRVEALDGHPAFALAARHPEVLSTLEETIAFNRRLPASGRFAGVRYDIEPYLLPEFRGLGRQAVMRQHLELLRRAGTLARRAGMSFGVDIPFWFDSWTRHFELAAGLDGRPYSERIIDLVDNLSVMDYRTRAHGPDGVIAHALGELRYASRRGKPVFVGLETVPLPDETVAELERSPATPAGAARLLLRPAGGSRVTCHWLSSARGDPRLDDAERLEGAVVLVLRSSVFAPSSKVTFAPRPPAELEAVMQSSATELLRWPSFAGFAIHSYESYRPWLAGGR